MLYHVTSWGPVLPGFIEYGYIGVDLFFVLSGFLIGWQLVKPYTVGMLPAWGKSFLRRAFRVLPAYWAYWRCTSPSRWLCIWAWPWLLVLCFT